MNGSVRLLALLSNPTAAGYSDYALATYPTIDVPELELSAFDVGFLRSEYARCRLDRSAADPLVTGGPDGIPLIWPSKGQRIDKMPNLPSVRIRLGAAPPTSAQLLMSWIEDRDPALAAEWMGFSDIGAFLSTVREKGRIKLGHDSSGEAPTNLPPELSRRLPMRLRA
jgi:hypothetical protein